MEMVLLIGVQGSGKSTFYKERFYQTHLRINRDMLKTPHRERVLMEACFRIQQPFVLDNMNLTRAGRAEAIRAAQAARFAVTGYFFKTTVAESLQRNAQRTGLAKVPKPGIFAAHKRLESPHLAEGFQKLLFVSIDASGQFLLEEAPALSNSKSPAEPGKCETSDAFI